MTNRTAQNLLASDPTLALRLSQILGGFKCFPRLGSGKWRSSGQYLPSSYLRPQWQPVPGLPLATLVKTASIASTALRMAAPVGYAGKLNSQRKMPYSLLNYPHQACRRYEWFIRISDWTFSDMTRLLSAASLRPIWDSNRGVPLFDKHWEWTPAPHVGQTRFKGDLILLILHLYATGWQRMSDLNHFSAGMFTSATGAAEAVSRLDGVTPNSKEPHP